MRVGPHVNTPHRGDVAAAFIRRVQPPMVKMLDSGWDGRIAAAARETGAAIIGRVYWDDQRLGASYGRFIDRTVEWARGKPDVQLIEGANEFAQSPGELERYAALEIERMRAMDAIGRKAVIGNFSCGQPDLGAWHLFRPALEYAATHGHVLGLHEYSGPVMQWMAGSNQWNDGRPTLDDPATDPLVEGWLTLRYRKLLALCRGWGIGRLQIAITESGIDDVQPRPGPQGKGWKSYLGTEYQNRAPFGDYADQMRWYGARLSEDQNIVGWVDFGFSQAGDWETFDLSNAAAMRERVEAAMLTLPRSYAAPAPTPPPPPEDTVSDQLAALLRARLGGRFVDDRNAMPRHATARYSTQPVARWTGIAVHHSTGPRDQAVSAIAAFHVNTNGWAGIGYHLAIRQGRVHYVGNVDTVRAHVYGRNHELIGVCVLGHYSNEDPDPADTTALRDTVAALDTFLGRQLPVDGHGSLSQPGHGTACPGRLAPIARAIRGGGGQLDAAGLVARARERQAIQLNPAAAIQRRILADGYVPTSPEFDWADASGSYVGQRAEHLRDGQARVYYCLVGRWSEVGWIRG